MLHKVAILGIGIHGPYENGISLAGSIVSVNQLGVTKEATDQQVAVPHLLGNAFPKSLRLSSRVFEPQQFQPPLAVGLIDEQAGIVGQLPELFEGRRKVIAFQIRNWPAASVPNDLARILHWRQVVHWNRRTKRRPFAFSKGEKVMNGLVGWLQD